MLVLLGLDGKSAMKNVTTVRDDNRLLLFIRIAETEVIGAVLFENVRKS